MTQEQFNEAMEIIVHHHSTKVSINLPENHFGGDVGRSKFRLHITECVPSVVNKLIGAGFMLSMTSEGLEVDKI